MSKWYDKFIAGMIILIFFGFVVIAIGSFFIRDTLIATPLSTEIKRIDKSDRYLVNVQFQDGHTEVIEVADNVLLGNTTSSDKYFSFKNAAEIYHATGKLTYFTIYVRGVRVGLISQFRKVYYIEQTAQK